MPDNPSRREVWDAVVASGEANAKSVFEMSRALAAMQARAEKAEESLERAEGDHRFVLTETVAAYEAKLAALESRLALNEAALIDAQKSMQMCVSCGWLLPNHAEECGRYPLVVEQMKARLAEVAPVVEAAEAWSRTAEEEPLMVAVRALRAARSLRGAGEGNAEARKGEEAGR